MCQQCIINLLCGWWSRSNEYYVKYVNLKCKQFTKEIGVSGGWMNSRISFILYNGNYQTTRLQETSFIWILQKHSCNLRWPENLSNCSNEDSELETKIRQMYDPEERDEPNGCRDNGRILMKKYKFHRRLDSPERICLVNGKLCYKKVPRQIEGCLR